MELTINGEVYVDFEEAMRLYGVGRNGTRTASIVKGWDRKPHPANHRWLVYRMDDILALIPLFRAHVPAQARLARKRLSRSDIRPFRAEAVELHPHPQVDFSQDQYLAKGRHNAL